MAIGTLTVGTPVLAYNEATGQNGYYPITAVHKNLDPILTYLTLKNGQQDRTEAVTTTPEHPFYVTAEVDTLARPKPVGHEDLNSHWVGAGHLQIGDKIRKADGTFGTVANVLTVQQTQEMFNLTVDQAHTFYVGKNGWLVHNSGTVGPLLPSELSVGPFGQLPSSVGDNLTGHHIPSNGQMKLYQKNGLFSGYTRDAGISLQMEQPTPGTGGRHRLTISYGRPTDPNLSPIEALRRDVADARKIYESQGYKGKMLDDALKAVIKLNLKKWPELFKC